MAATGNTDSKMNGESATNATLKRPKASLLFTSLLTAAPRERNGGPGRIRTCNQGIHCCPDVSKGSGLSLHPRLSKKFEEGGGVRDALACYQGHSEFAPGLHVPGV